MAAGSADRAKNSKMAADMVKRGIFHGKRTTTPHHNNMPVDEAGSAAYRRMNARKKNK